MDWQRGMGWKCLWVVACGALLLGCGGGAADAPPERPVSAREATCPAVVVPSHGAEPQNQPLRERVLSLKAHPLAVCNDGSPASYRFRPGVGLARNRWLVVLEGGGHCGTSASCAERWEQAPALMSSASRVDGRVVTEPQHGIRSGSPSENPDFWDANLVLIDYCSSDLWSGERRGNAALPVTDAGHWHFRGRDIIHAVLDDLNPDGIGGADEVFLMGSSAGGIGTALNLDEVAQRFSTARVLGAMDAAFFIDHPSFDPLTGRESTASPTASHQDLLDSASVWGGHGDASCESSAPPEGLEYCRSPSYVVSRHHVSTPVFVRQSLADRVQTKVLVSEDDTSKAAMAYRFRFWSALWKQLSAVTDTAVFGTADTRHGILGQEAWADMQVGGVALPAAIGAWYRDPCGHRISLLVKP